MLVIYFIQGELTKSIKIGYTRDHLGYRISSLQGGSPDRLTVLGVKQGAKPEERKLHKRFARYRTHGEWFEPSAKLLRFIAHATRPWAIGRNWTHGTPGQRAAWARKRVGRGAVLHGAQPKESR